MICTRESSFRHLESFLPGVFVSSCLVMLLLFPRLLVWNGLLCRKSWSFNYGSSFRICWVLEDESQKHFLIEIYWHVIDLFGLNWRWSFIKQCKTFGSGSLMPLSPIIINHETYFNTLTRKAWGPHNEGFVFGLVVKANDTLVNSLSQANQNQ